MHLPVYLDNNATTPCDPNVVDAMLPFFTRHFGNAASHNHPYGWYAKEAVEIAREQLAKLVGAEPVEIVFTSGATEADNLALKGVFVSYRSKGNHIITVSTEHKAVLDTCKHIEMRGGEITYLPVRADGLIDLQQLEAAIRSTTILIAVMYANNETGVVHDVKAVASIAKKHNILFFSDAAQAAGKIPIHVKNDGIDLASFSSHKMYGPKGVGALYISRKDPRVKLVAQIDGGGHERGMRSGTLNVPGIVGFGKAAQLATEEMKEECRRLAQLRNKLEAALLQLPGTGVNGNIHHRLPHVTNISFDAIKGEGLISGLNNYIAASAGSACMSALPEPSYVLKAMGLPDDLAYASLRFSLGRFNTLQEIDYAIERVNEVVQKLRK